MIIVHTNVISEILRPSLDHAVLSWFGAQARSALHATSITRAELMRGAWLLPQGKRKSALLKLLQDILDTNFRHKILSFDCAAADAYAVLTSTRQSSGRPMSQSDAMIAAIAITHKATLATRNIRDFQGCGVELVNPWEGK